jgi:hypothetical protein
MMNDEAFCFVAKSSAMQWKSLIVYQANTPSPGAV